MASSSRPGMGAIPYTAGVTFRVWAPFASAVCVAGSFNGWSTESAPLTQEGNGYWSADVAGAQVGDEYKFVITNADTAALLWKNDPYARSMTNSVGHSIVANPDYVWESAGYSTPPWNELVIYELHVGSFMFDPASPNRRGNFDTVIGELYLQDLGINAIQVMAADEFPGDISWGYNPAFIFAIEQSYGGPNGFRRLVDAAHARGIAVIFDVVYNHLGPSDLDLWKFDGWSPTGRDDEGGIYFYNDWRKKTPWGDTRPDYGRGEVRQYIRDNALRWLEQRYCDGLRWDATGWIRNVRGANNDPGSDIGGAGSRSGSGPGVDLAGKRRQLLLPKALDPRRGARLYRARHPDALHGPGIPGMGSMVGCPRTRLVEGGPLFGHPKFVSRPDPAPPQLV